MMPHEAEYEKVERMTHDQILDALSSQEPERIRAAIWSATYYDSDWRWVQDQCLSLLNFPDLWVRRNAVSCLGNLAVFHKQLDVERVIPKLEEAKRDEELRPFVEDSLEEIRHNIYSR